MDGYSYTELLYAQPSLLSGASRVLDVGATFDNYNDKTTYQQADMVALKSDWLAIGQDLHFAIVKINK